MPQPDFYAIFGVPPSASQQEIRAAHRELVKRYHPDIYSTGDDKARATERLQAINEAYAVLG
ncbi:MAG TPA: J domain-containing protein, partial [Candidatus Binatia bacterium]